MFTNPTCALFTVALHLTASSFLVYAYSQRINYQSRYAGLALKYKKFIDVTLVFECPNIYKITIRI